MTGSPSFDLQTLLHHRDYLRALTRSLVADEGRAEDAVQETWLAALQRPPERLESARSWLARVAANFARRTAGREGERLERERRAARPEAHEETARVDFELLERLARALGGLPEPYRTAIHQRYWEDLVPGAIAAREGLSVETVKTRLRRGLELLRRELDAGYGSREAWCALFLARPSSLFAPRVGAGVGAGAAAGSSLLEGLLAMKLLGVLGTALAALVLVLVVREARRPDVSRPTASLAGPTTAAPLADVGAAAPVQLAEEEPAGTRRAQVTGAAPSRPAPADAARRAHLRVVDMDEVPIAGARVTDPREVEERTGGDGRVELLLPEPGGRWTLVVEADEFLPAQVEVDLAAAGSDLGTCTLLRGARVTGHVLDPAGLGVPEALVVTTLPGQEAWSGVAALASSPGFTLPHARTDAHGRFELRGVPPGRVRLRAGAGGLADGSSDVLDLAAESDTVDVRIRLLPLARGSEISGRVRLPRGDSFDGSPYEGLSIWTLHDSSEGWRSHTAPVEPDGTFHVRLEEAVPHDVWVDEEPGGWDQTRQVFTGERRLAGFRPLVERDVRPGTSGLVLSFEEAPRIELDVRGPGGEALERFTLGIVTSSGEDLRQEIPWYREVAPPVRIDVPATDFWITVAADGHERKGLGPWSPLDVPRALEVTLERVPESTGRVTSCGRPLADATVELFREADREHVARSRGFLLRTATVPSAIARTASDGTFRLTVRRPGSYLLLAGAPGYARAELGPLELGPWSTTEGLDLELTGGGALEGRVLLPPGEDPAGVLVGVSRGDVHGRILAVREDGTFRFEGLTPGPWWIGRMNGLEGPTTIRSAREPVVWRGNCTVVEGRTTTHELDFRDERRTRIEGEWILEGLEGAPLVVILRRGTLREPGPDGDLDRAQLDPDGAFRLVAPEPGTYHVLLQAFAEAGVLAARELEVRGGIERWRDRIEVGELRVRLAPGSPSRPADLPAEPELAFLVETPEGVTGCALRPDGSGGFASSFAPAGSGRLVYATPETEARPPFSWPVATEVTVRAGETTVVD